MGVMLQRDNNTQRLYLHNVAIEKDTANITKADLLTTSAPEDDHIFITMILQNALAVKYRKILNELDPENNPNARKSKDDTIYDSSEIEDLFDDYEDSGMPDEVDPRDPYGRTTRQMIDDENFELNALLDKALKI